MHCHLYRLRRRQRGRENNTRHFTYRMKALTINDDMLATFPIRIYKAPTTNNETMEIQSNMVENKNDENKNDENKNDENKNDENKNDENKNDENKSDENKNDENKNDENKNDVNNSEAQSQDLSDTAPNSPTSLTSSPASESED